ncbi:baculoviral IAP repeat-containing protein 7 [Malaclemys terrapin pileata]|uniref:baculoviral IAP repeat-containing protein 7 n=1 Tax=Malaclemys terrapin pileata TaxID=2991368 RepID=UPI0023A863DE|nr:baculoviral IAP repeat-containing protein 7 [Malaclemys terrapin pileata]
MREHQKFFPTCKFICGEDVGNQQMLPFLEILDYVDGQILSLLQRMDVEEAALPSQPEYPEMETEAMRLATFQSWPPYTELYPEQLARAGFFYTGQGDTVRCFYCDGSLRNWELGDDPWREHAKWFPRCEFLLQSRGRDFVSSVQDSDFNAPGGSWQRAEQDPPVPQDSVGNRELSSPLDQSSIVQNVLQMGFDHSLVMSLVQNRHLLTGTCYLSVSELVLDLLQVDGEESSSAEERERTERETGLQGQRRDAQAECSKESEPPLSTEEQLRRLQEERMCKVCMDKDVSIVFVPCGHLVVCAECAPSLRRCPICRAVIRGSVRTFMS